MSILAIFCIYWKGWVDDRTSVNEIVYNSISELIGIDCMWIKGRELEDELDVA